MQGKFCGCACAFLAMDLLASMANCSLWPGINLVPTSALLHMEMRRFLRTKYGIKVRRTRAANCHVPAAAPARNMFCNRVGPMASAADPLLPGKSRG